MVIWPERDDSLELTPEDLTRAAAISRAALAPAVERDWSVAAGDLARSCRRTLDHIVDTLLLYTGLFATRATGRIPFVRDGDPNRTVPELLGTMGTAATILAEVCRAAPPDARGFHPAGMADASGFVGMACQEILDHTYDISLGLGLPFHPGDEALIARIVARIFPWAPADAAPWDALRWAAGRIALPSHPRLDANWWWHCAPLSEWDGTIKRRTAETPPAWT